MFFYRALAKRLLTIIEDGFLKMIIDAMENNRPRKTSVVYEDSTKPISMNHLSMPRCQYYSPPSLSLVRKAYELSYSSSISQIFEAISKDQTKLTTFNIMEEPVCYSARDSSLKNFINCIYYGALPSKKKENIPHIL